jgi:hypothetical protein
MFAKCRASPLQWQSVGYGESSFQQVALMFAFITLHKSRLRSLIFSPYGTDKREGAGNPVMVPAGLMSTGVVHKGSP